MSHGEWWALLSGLFAGIGVGAWLIDMGSRAAKKLDP